MVWAINAELGRHTVHGYCLACIVPEIQSSRLCSYQICVHADKTALYSCLKSHFLLFVTYNFVSCLRSDIVIYGDVDHSYLLTYLLGFSNCTDVAAVVVLWPAVGTLCQHDWRRLYRTRTWVDVAREGTHVSITVGWRWLSRHITCSQCTTSCLAPAQRLLHESSSVSFLSVYFLGIC